MEGQALMRDTQGVLHGASPDSLRESSNVVFHKIGLTPPVSQPRALT